MAIDKPSLDDRFGAPTVLGLLPLGIWAAHFFGSYFVARTACALDLHAVTVVDLSVLTIVLWSLSAIAIGALLAMLLHAWRHRRRGLLAAVYLGSIVIALAGVLWSTLPIALVFACDNVYQ